MNLLLLTRTDRLSSVKRIFLAFCLCLMAISTFAQQAVLKGIVQDGYSESNLSGARVTIDSLKIGTTTSIDGAFVLSNIPPGKHKLTITYLTYSTLDSVLVLSKGEIKDIQIAMTPEDIRGEAVLITAQAFGQTQAINQQLNLDAIANVVSADRIQELPDVNAAEAIARLPGVAINRSGGEGQKVVIRGLEPKFAAITINGVNLPSNSGTDRSVDLSLIAPELLDGIEVFKSPLPDMDAEAVGGTVNLKLRKAPKDFKLLVKGLWGYNDLNDDFRDNKSVLQLSNRVFKDKLGIVFQAGNERFNRGGDIQIQNWFRGPTNDSTGITEILGNSLVLQDRREIRRRFNTSLGLDYDWGRSQFSFFGLFSRTSRDRFLMQESYKPADQEIDFIGQEIENSLDLSFLSLTGNHVLGAFQIDWTLADSRSRGRTPYNFQMLFRDNNDPFVDGLNNVGNPGTFLAAAQPNLQESILRSAALTQSSVAENMRTATLNIELPYKLSKKIFGSLKFGGKYKSIERDRQVDELREDFYYLGANEARRAIEAYDGELQFLPQNNLLININSFTDDQNEAQFQDLEGQDIGLNATLDPDKMRDWHDAQLSLLNVNREALVDNYQVNETVSAAYMMLKFKVGEKLTIIPGFRYEYSDNSYTGGYSTINGRYGVNGVFFDTTTFQQYGEFLPHLHIKYKPLEWLDFRASYAQTMARPDFLFVTPRFQIDDNQTVIRAGNPDLQYAVSTNYDFAVSAYKGGYGLISVGVFSKDVENIFYPWQTNLATDSLAAAFGFPDNRGYSLESYLNSQTSRVYGYEIDFQTTLSFLPKALAGLVLNINYARLYSETDVFFLTSERRLIIRNPPIFEDIFTNSEREVPMRSQAPHVLRTSLGYDYKKFSVRISAAYQGTKVRNYSVNKDFDTFDSDFWRVDASMKQRIGDHWSIFLNLNNLSNQRDISFTRTPSFVNRVETYGITGTMGVQYKL
ncbi:MAG: TonB-dependent receptor [Bacteroidota bacterium]